MDESGTRSREPLPDSSRCETGQLRKLAALEAVQISEQNERPVLGAQTSGEQVSYGHDLLVLAACPGCTVDEAVKDLRKAAPPSQRLQGTVTRDAIEPCLRVANARKLRTRAQGVVERVLQEIFRQRAIVHHLRQIPTNRKLATHKQALDSPSKSLIVQRDHA
jgi:hypothetical protein